MIVAVDPAVYAAAARRIEVIEQQRDARRPRQEARHVAIGALVIVADKGDVAVGIHEEIAIAPGVERHRERQRHRRAVVVAEGNLVADRALKRAVGSAQIERANAGPDERDGDRPQIVRVRRQDQIAFVPDYRNLPDVF